MRKTKTLTPSMARHAVMQTLLFLRGEGADVAEIAKMGNPMPVAVAVLRAVVDASKAVAMAGAR